MGRSARHSYNGVILSQLVPAIAEEEQLLNMPRTTGIGTWLEFFKSRSHVDRGKCEINQVYHWNIQSLRRCHGLVTLHGQFSKWSNQLGISSIFLNFFYPVGSWCSFHLWF